MTRLDGLGVSPGIAIGQATLVRNGERTLPRYKIPPEGVRRELRRFLVARRRAREEILDLRARATATLGAKYAAIFDAHLLILDDRKLGRETFALVRERRINAEWALAATVNRLLRAFHTAEDPYLRERSSDIEDVHDRVQRILAGKENAHAQRLPLTEDTIIVARALSPSDAMWLHQPHIVGIVTEEGSRSSHTAILANALEIPAVLGASHATTCIDDGANLIVDGTHGKVVIEPTELELAAYTSARAKRREIERQFEAERGPVLTRDGFEIAIAANIEFPEEMETCRRVGAQGVGLYRSEFLFLSTAPSLPSEADHAQAYEWIARTAHPDPVIVRTLDLGGEKYFHEVLEGGEANPVMGLRAVRFCLQRRDIFRTQVRGLLRVAMEFRNVRILVPMVTGIEEWRSVRDFIDDVRTELIREGVDAPAVPLGCMIETPAAALVADTLAGECDFLSIGTNDLIQYTIAVDRSNGSVSYLYDPLHPAVLSLIEATLAAGRRRGVPVSLCGEMASDPFGAIVLLGLGLRAFSCNALLIPQIRRLLRSVSVAEAAEAVALARQSESGTGIRASLEASFAGLIAEVLERRNEPR